MPKLDPLKALVPDNNKKKPFYIIGIGSSAGGLKALEEFLDNCPSNTGFAFVIIQHLSPDYKSLMPELLSRHTDMSVKEAKEGDEVQANHVYLIPGVKNLQIRNGRLELTQRPPSSQINFSIDIFFNSLAIEKREKAVAIILSGTGSDGTKGAKSIKEIGGTIFVQDPNSAAFDGMPRSAIGAGLADFILDSKEMGRELVDFVSFPSFPEQAHKEGHVSSSEELLKRILKIIKVHVGYDFSSYKKPTLLRRTAKRINITKCKTVENYIDYLHNNTDEKFILTNEFLIGVTKFFRDTSAFSILRDNVIPAIVNKKKEGESIKIWTVACSSGEEAYSIAILLEEYLRVMQLEVSYKIFATDLDDRGIEVANKGIYNQNIESEVSTEVLGKYFVRKENKYQILPTIRKNIIFSKHDVLQNPPFSKMDLVSCRNMLIYMDNDIQHKILSSLHYSLNLNGYLFLGSSENLGLLGKNFETVSTKWKIYKNIRTERVYNVNKGSDAWSIRPERTIGVANKKNTSFNDKIIKSINTILMDELNVVSVCVDESYEIIHASGKLKKYVKFPEEGYSNSLLKILPDKLSIPISTAIRKIESSSVLTVDKEIRFILENELKHVKLVVRSFNVASYNSRSFLITIIEEFGQEINEEMKAEIAPSFDGSDKHQLKELKDALNLTKENLQSTIEELETSNEEMQATNEELMASNEELQSTNEELQSLNEEIHTVNAELQEKNTQLVELNSDVENLMKNITIGAMFLDRDFRVRKYTPALNEHFHLLAEDIGRSIAHFSGTIGGGDLVEHSKEVIRTLQPYSKEVTKGSGKWFVMQIFPYRNPKDTIEGVVVNFIDITELKKVIEEKEELNTFLGHLTNTNPAIIYIYDMVEMRNVYANASIWEHAGYSSSDLELLGENLLSVIVHKDDLPKIFAHHEKLKTLDDNQELQVEYRLVHKDTGEYIWVLSTDKINERDSKGEVRTILGVAMVTTEIKNITAQLKESEERYKLAISATASALWEWTNPTMDDVWWSDELNHLLGYKKGKMKPLFSEFLKLIHPDQLEDFTNSLKAYLKNGTPLKEEIQVKTKNKGFKWFKINAQDRPKQAISTTKVVGTLKDIDQKKEAEQKMAQLNIELERFAYLASHDLKEPLGTVTSFIQLFKEEYTDKLDDNGKQYLNYIDNACARMVKLTNDLLSYSQLDHSNLLFETVNLNDLLTEVLEDLQITIKNTNAQITIDELPTTVCDSVQMKQLFQNLISNSLKYRRKGEIEIHIGAVHKASQTTFFVKDNGIGIDKKDQAQIFDIFKRLHSQSEYEGTGIGLANCKRILDNHKGKIWVESKVNEGSTFLFTIPKLK